MQADIRTPADRGEHRRLGEDFGIRPDADLEILRPHALVDQCLLDLGRLRRTGLQIGEAAADQRADTLADRGGAFRIAGRLLLDDALDHRLRKGNAAGLDCLQVDGRNEIGTRLIRSSGTVGGDVRQRANRLATCCTDEAGGILPLEQGAQRRRLARRDVDQHTLA